jgi:hypothetical protein
MVVIPPVVMSCFYGMCGKAKNRIEEENASVPVENSWIVAAEASTTEKPEKRNQMLHLLF